jgi:SAM-dependent methyltransferase
MSASVGAERILAIAFGFRSARVLLSAAEIGVFDALACGPLDGRHLCAAVQLHPRAAADFFDALVALGLLTRDPAGRYANGAEAVEFLQSDGATTLVGLLDYLSGVQYDSWGKLTAALRQGRPQGVASPANGFDKLYDDLAAFDRFMNAMSAGIVLPARALAERFDWARYRSFADIGCAQGRMAAEIAGCHRHLTGIGFDLPRVATTFAGHIRARGLGDRVTFQGGDFFVDPLPRVDVIVLARILHDWDVSTRRSLLDKAFAALPAGGAAIVCEQLIDDERRVHAQPLLASLNMLLQTEAGSESTLGECAGWMLASGFRETQVISLGGAYSALVAIK